MLSNNPVIFIKRTDLVESDNLETSAVFRVMPRSVRIQQWTVFFLFQFRRV